MGGIARHMNHIYDDMNMKFSTILEIFELASSGKLEATEKVDGQNIYFTYDVKSKSTRFARSEEQAARGGLTKDELNAEFTKKRDESADPSDYQSVVDAFYLGMSTIENSLQKVPADVKSTVFDRTKDIEDRQISTVYMNCEVMYSGNRNLILYDGDFIVFHNYDILDESLKALSDEDLYKIDSAMRQKFMTIVAEIEKNEAAAAASQWRVVGPQVVALNNMGEEGSSAFVAEARSDLLKIVEELGLGIDSTFGEYVKEAVRQKIIPRIQLSKPLSQELISGLCDAVEDPREWSNSPTPASLSLSSDSRERSRQIKTMHGGDKADTKIVASLFTKSYGTALQGVLLEPFAQFAVTYTSKILDGVESKFMKDSKFGRDVFVETVNMSIEHFRQKFKEEDAPSSEISKLKALQKDPSAMSSLDRKAKSTLKKVVQKSEDFRHKYEKQMARLVSVDRITTPVEGVVFEYPPGSNSYYKFTGGFAASNQLLGMLGWAEKERIAFAAKEKVADSAQRKITEARLKALIRKKINNF